MNGKGNFYYGGIDDGSKKNVEAVFRDDARVFIKNQ